MASVGQRWQCQAPLAGGETCGKIWQVDADMDGKIWVTDPPESTGAPLEVFRRVDDEELDYWLTEELGAMTFAAGDNPDPSEVVAAIRKHFEIGRKQ